MIAVGADHVVVLVQRSDRADADGLLADVEMEEAADLPLRVRARGLFFEAPDDEHLAIEVGEVIELPARPGHRRGGFRGLRGFQEKKRSNPGRP